jgi:hypothetical protein
MYTKKVDPIELLTNPRIFLKAWLHDKGYQPLTGRAFKLQDGSTTSSTDLFATIWLDYMEQLRAYHASTPGPRPKPFLERDLCKALDEYLLTAAQARIKATIERLRCTGENLSELEKLARALNPLADQVDKNALAHHIWQIKRKLQNRTVKDHLMVVFVGPQGGGKSVAISKLHAPIEDLTLWSSLDQIADSRSQLGLEEYFAIVCDEMQGADRADINALKRIITESKTGARPMGTNKLASGKQNATLIGASNRAIDEIIYDPTGNRRFYQINVSEKANWEVINEIDFDAAFRGVNEDDENGYAARSAPEIREKQSQYATKDDIELFVGDHELSKDVAHQTQFISSSMLFQIYQCWAKARGCKEMKDSQLVKILKNRGYVTSTRKVVNGTQVRGVLVSRGILSLHEETQVVFRSQEDTKDRKSDGEL